MKSVVHKRFQMQLLFAMVAAISVAALTVELLLDVVRHAESFVLADTGRALDHAARELDREYRLRLRGDTSWSELPAAARDVTLRAISQTVLSAYPGVEGGFWTPGQFLGYSYPTHDGGSPKVDVPSAEKSAIEETVAAAQRGNKSERILRGKHDLVSISALPASRVGGASAWTMKRLPGLAEQAPRTRGFLLAALLTAALLGAAGVLATGVGLHRGVAQIKRGLALVNKDFTRELPERGDELGEISAAINEMTRTRRRLEAEVRREDRARTMGRLVGRVAHELRNPLNSIRLSLQMLSSRQRENRLRAGDFQMVVEEVDRMNALLGDLLAFQQPRPARLEPRAVGPILEDCARLVRPQAEERGVDLVVEDGAGERAEVDEHYVRRILVNLVLNAIEASPPGERVTVHSAMDAAGLAITVSDSGPGLSPAQMEHLFEPFYTTKTNGNGLGLAVSREMAQSMGGSLHAVNLGRGGASFLLRLRETHAE